MEIQHTVVFRLVHLPGSGEESAFLTAARDALASIPGVGRFTINRQVSPKSELAWQFSMVFADQDAYDAYNNHSSHIAFVETHWVPEVDSFQEYDFAAL